jgi:prepilin-type N-terminal cleavage/methylation domain-containing protein
MAALEPKMTLVTTTSIKYRNKAFTLVELLIVMTIIVAMISVAAPYAKNSNKETLVLNEALNIKELLFYAIDISRSSNSAIRFIHSKIDRSYWLQTSNLQGQSEFKKLDNSLGTPHHYDNAIQSIITEGTESTKGFDYIIFDPRKQPPTDITIRLETLDCWAELTVDKKNVRVLNGNY